MFFRVALSLPLMPETKPTRPFDHSTLQLALIVGLSLMLVVLLVSGLVYVVAVHQRLIAPPAFAVRLGRYELRAPCPRGILCDEFTPFYALWWGEPQPDGSIQYQELFFVYLKLDRDH